MRLVFSAGVTVGAHFALIVPGTGQVWRSRAIENASLWRRRRLRGLGRIWRILLRQGSCRGGSRLSTSAVQVMPANAGAHAEEHRDNRTKAISS